jgi:uncharacterized coiled-coil protein SlyX
MAINLEREIKRLERRLVEQSIYIQELERRIDQKDEAIEQALAIVTKGEKQWCSDSQARLR